MGAIALSLVRVRELCIDVKSNTIVRAVMVEKLAKEERAGKGNKEAPETASFPPVTYLLKLFLLAFMNR